MESIKELFIGKAKKYNRFIETSKHEGHSCINCIRKHLSYPYTCNDGWNFCRDGDGVNKGSVCLNWTDNKQCKVD
jgi:hypothetical protein